MVVSGEDSKMVFGSGINQVETGSGKSHVKS